MQLCTPGIPDNTKERLDGDNISLRDSERISTQKETEHQKSQANCKKEVRERDRVLKVGCWDNIQIASLECGNLRKGKAPEKERGDGR